ncbi:hypothetical protein ACFX15_013144 [Malus domestica]|nr:uncharacterized protein LOC114821052 isoform X1 [Malus domestica]XP_028948664.1 uncharacterized protein LOC114821052 isoform X1 [Malus domestica]XP_028948665.1 uncharacterized protein LOC114821052 isoform X1 [Malus domestica]XP_028948667.1 uncharacterized protein LOC114821052 isoform X1 [Malus domestica]
MRPNHRSTGEMMALDTITSVIGRSPTLCASSETPLAAILAVEVAVVRVFISRLQHKTKQQHDKEKSSQERGSKSDHLHPRRSLEFASTKEKEGVIWVLEPEKVPKNWQEKALREQKREKEFFEVSPIKRYAKIKNKLLILTESDGSQTAIQLKGCTIEAVSSTSLSSRKWAKRFPIKLDSKATLYKGSKILYLYLKTSVEKESWCKTLRLASCDDKEKLDWFTKLHEEFRCYLTLLNTGHPSLMKQSGGLYAAEPTDRENRIDGSSSKVRMFLRKFTKKSSKIGPENKLSWTSSLGREERKISEKVRPSQDFVSSSSLADASPLVKRAQSFSEGNLAIPPSSTLTHSGSQSHISVISDAGSDEKFGSDEGTLCWNLLISRLFFDAKSSVEMKRTIKAQIQRTLSNMRTPSYMGEVICTDINIGNLPPYIHGLKVLPMDMNDVWALEVDIGYYGGAVLDVETRLEVRELDFQRGSEDLRPESGSVGDVSADLLEEFEHFGKQLNLAEGTVDAPENKEECDPKSDGSKSSKSSMSASNYGSRWKSLLNSIAKQVSQVPLSLAIRITSLRGTLRLQIKPPPSDRLWFAFTSMPDIDFNLDSSVGDHKITNGHIALFLISRLKTAIRETLVLPNFESVCIPWMLAEKDDWVLRKVAPFIWVNPESVNDPTTVCEVPIVQPSEGKYKTEASSGISVDRTKHKKLKKTESIEQPIGESSDVLAFSVSSNDLSAGNTGGTCQELRTPLLGNGELEDSFKHKVEGIPESQSLSRSTILLDKQNHSFEEDDPRLKRTGRRARMLDLGKKMGEKLEEKRRQVEEKSRNIVEKMRGP